MPNVTIDPSHYEREELKSAPGAYIMVRPLPYGQKLARRDKATRMYMEATPGKNRKQAEEEVQRFQLETMNEWAVLFDFSFCIGDHNLEDVNGVKLDLSNPLSLKVLDPRVGGEIEQLLARYNGDEDEQELEDFIKQHVSPTPAEGNTSPAHLTAAD